MRLSFQALGAAALLGLLTCASAMPHHHHHHHHQYLTRRAASGQTVAYWGQNTENGDLAAYCTSTAGIDILVLSFLYAYGNGAVIPSGVIGPSCYISTTGEGQTCDDLASAISTCQTAGIKIILSLGGASSSYSLSSDTEAQSIADNLWAMFGNPAIAAPGNTTSGRPFGNVIVDGFDFDIEVPTGQEYYAAMISELRTIFQSDPDHTYYITGAPQCPLPEPNMGVIIGNSTFDYLWVQWYNNNNYAPDPCSLGFGDNAPFNYDDWVSFLATTPSANAKLFIGVPASTLASTGSASGAEYYATPDELAELVSEYNNDTAFGGIMMWSAGYSDSNVNDGCTYAQEAHAILLTGSPCSDGPAPGGSGASGTTTTGTTATGTATPAATTSNTGTTGTSTASSAMATGTAVAQWGQCGGEGYTGSTVCESPYTCVEGSVWWSSCH